MSEASYKSDAFDSKLTNDPEDTGRKRQKGKKSAEKRERQVRDWWYQARTQHSTNRQDQSIDVNYVDSLQWSEDDKKVVEDRNQAPYTFNLVKPTIDWLSGTERRTRIDWRVLPRQGGQQAGKDALLKTQLLKYIQDVNKGAFVRSRAFRDAIAAGAGWLELGVRGDPTDEPIYMRREHWRNIWYDPMAVELDLSDARYLFRAKIVDLDVAEAVWPQKRDMLRRAAELRDRSPYSGEEELADIQLYNDPYAPMLFHTDDAQYWNQNRRTGVRLIECWYRNPVAVKRMYGETEFPHKVYDPKNEEMANEVAKKYASLYDAIEMQMWVCIFVDRGDNKEGLILQDQRSPYRHNRFPFVPIWAYRRDYDGMPYGPVRQMRDPQDDLNKRRSKALYVLSTNRVIADQNAIVGMDDDDIAEEAARPDAVFIKRPGTEFEIQNDTKLAREHIMLEMEDRNYIREVGGVTGENLGVETKSLSGRAILAKQDQGGVVTQTLFDNLRLATQLSGEILLSLCEQFMTAEKQIRIAGDRGKPDFLEINTSEENDITKQQAEFVVAEQDFRETTRLAMFETLMEMLGTLDSELAIQLLDMAVEVSDLPEPIKSEWVRRLRKMTGQTDPNTETEDERLAREQAEMAAQQREQAMAWKERMANLEQMIAKAQETYMKSARSYVEAMTQATALAPTVLTDPASVEVAAALVDEGAGDIEDPTMEDPVVQEAVR